MAARPPYPWHYADDALDDLDNIADWYVEQEAWDAALEVSDRIRARVPSIADTPKAWHVGVSGHRERNFTDTPFRVMYDFEDDHVTILRIKHTKQQWP